MSVNINRSYTFFGFSDPDQLSRQLETELDNVGSTINSANAGNLTWDNIKVTNLTSTNTTLSNPLPATGGGTGTGTVAQGDTLYGSAPNTWAKLPKNTTSTRYLANTGSSNNPNWDQVNVTNGVTGTLPIGSGGTNSNGALSNSKVMVSSGGAIVESTLATLNAAGYLIGNIIQIVQGTDTTSTNSSGTTYTSTATTATITPKATTHKILACVTGTLTDTSVSTSNSLASIFRGSTDLSNGNGFVAIAGTVTGSQGTPAAMIFLDNPATTSATTYTVKIKSTVAASATWNITTGTAVITLIEVAL